MRLVAQVLDEPLHVGHRHAEDRARLRDDIFLNHDAAEVVRAKFQRDLADFLALRHPRTLNVGEIVQINPAQRLRPQIFVRANRRRLQVGVLRLERPADERGETFRFVLLRAQPLQMLDAVFNRLDVAEHHRRARIQTEPVRHVHHFQPVAAHGFQR